MRALFTLLTFLLVLVNGWTDAPNAIACCVGTRSLSPSRAVMLAAISNFAGATLMALLHTGVAETLFGLADFGENPDLALRGLCAALLVVVLWGTVAWMFGLPTSESHALISAMTGASLALCGDASVIQGEEWSKVLWGLLLTTVPACLLGFLLNRLLQGLLRNAERRRATTYFTRAQRFSAAGNAFLHGAQDSQKFMGVYLLGLSLFRGNGSFEGQIPLSLALAVSAVMSLGTLLGGSRIIKKIGCDLVEMDAVSGSVADAASAASLLLCSLLGIPASTTHSKSSAMIGTGLCRKGRVDPSIAGQLLGAWGLTFPACGVLGFLLTRIIL